jgi:hypothetical protein
MAVGKIHRFDLFDLFDLSSCFSCLACSWPQNYLISGPIKSRCFGHGDLVYPSKNYF